MTGADELHDTRPRLFTPERARLGSTAFSSRLLGLHENSAGVEVVPVDAEPSANGAGLRRQRFISGA